MVNLDAADIDTVGSSDPFGSQRSGLSGTDLYDPLIAHSGSCRGWDALLTETVGVPVHALLAADRREAPAVVVRLLDAAAKDAVLVTFANPGTALLARRSAAFRQDLRAFDLVLPDGNGLCLAIKWLHQLQGRRVSFDSTSLAPEIFDLACRRGLSVVLIGGEPQVAERARARIVEHFPGLRLTSTFDGFGEIEAKVRAIRELQPDIVICGMGGAKQESFLLRLREQGWRGWGFTCGGYLNQLHDGITYYPRWMDATNLRWAYRLVREPGRLWRRYLIDYSHFGLLLLAALASKHRASKRQHAPISA